MEEIIYFEENPKRHGVIRFVKNYRRGNWFRKERIEYCLTSTDSLSFNDQADIDKACARIKKDYPDAKISHDTFSAFSKKYDLHRFWVIAHWENKVKMYYDGSDGHGKATYTTDMDSVRMMLSYRSARETLLTIQQTTRDRVWVMPVYLNLVNELLTPVMMITCTTKRSKQETKYLARVEGNRLRLVNTSDAAQKFAYEAVLTMYEHLVTHNKNFMYAVLPVFKDNVHCRNIENYMREKKISRMVVMDLQLKFLNRKEKKYENN